MKTNLINSTFVGITFLLVAGCASMTQAPSTTPSATVSIHEWSAAYYAQAETGKGTLVLQRRAAPFHHLWWRALAARALKRSLPPARSIT